MIDFSRRNGCFSAASSSVTSCILRKLSYMLRRVAAQTRRRLINCCQSLDSSSSETAYQLVVASDELRLSSKTVVSDSVGGELLSGSAAGDLGLLAAETTRML